VENQETRFERDLVRLLLAAFERGATPDRKSPPPTCLKVVVAKYVEMLKIDRERRGFTMTEVRVPPL
jgi:hypothetical protein